MPYVVTQSCCADASCVVACPVNCIHPAPGEPEFASAEMLYIDADSCVDCGACVTACPAAAIKPHTALEAHEEPFLSLNADYFATFGHDDRRPLATVRQQRRLRRAGPFRVAVVGAGPAGLYAADELLKHPEINVDVFDRLPTPYGLVRAGVAPDHPRTKQVQEMFGQIERQPGFRYFLDVEVGTSITHADLSAAYHGVLYSVGASSDRRLGIEGEGLRGSLSATDLVGWYNAHPDKQDLDVPLDHERVVVIGNGNVALDVARILTAPSGSLAQTDVAPGAREALEDSGIREVVVLGRRGPEHAAFTLPELIGLAALTDRNVVVELGPGDVERLGTDTRGRVLAELAARSPDPDLPTIRLRFHTPPRAILGADRVTGLATGTETDAGEVIEAGLVLRAIGYHGQPVADLPYDESTGTVPHDRGRVTSGTYVAGWIKRGPNGYIGTNKSDAEESVAAFLDDVDMDRVGVTNSSEEFDRLVAARTDVVDLPGWRAIDAEERRRGKLEGSARHKIDSVAELRDVARSATEVPRRRGRRYPANQRHQYRKDRTRRS